jgi:hypothetical protein
MPLLKKTPLNKVHHNLRARMMGFAGWELPVWYTSILEEHETVRSAAGIFDVSDMGRIWITDIPCQDRPLSDSLECRQRGAEAWLAISLVGL